MKKIIILIITLGLFCSSSFAQQIKSSYFIDRSPIGMSMNASHTPDRGYVNIPILGAVGLGYSSNSLSLDDFIYPTSNGSVTFLDPSVNSTDFLSGLSEHNRLNIDLNTSLMGVGMYLKKDQFWSFNVGFNSYTGMNTPKELYRFMKVGTGADGDVFDIQDTRLFTESYLDMSVGHSRKINDKLSLGARAKVLLGIMRGDMNMHNINLTANADRWAASSQGTMNLYMSGASSELKYKSDNQYINSVDIDGFGFAGIGLAIDLGATYKLTDKITLYGAINDLGFIAWSKGSNVSGSASGDFIFEGFDIPYTGGQSSIEDQMDSIEDDFTDLYSFNEAASHGSVKMISTSFNLGGEYTLIEDQLGFGLLYSARVTPIQFQHEITVSTNYSPIWWFDASLSYSFLNSSFNTFGLALNFSPSWINFFVGTDYIFTKVSPEFIPISQNAANFYLGISVPIGNKHN